MLNTTIKPSKLRIALLCTGLLGLLFLLGYGFRESISLEGTVLVVLLVFFLIVQSVRFYMGSLDKQRLLYIQQILEDKKQLDELIYLYEAVNKATHDVIWDYDLIRNELRWMPGFEETYGYTHENQPSDFWEMKRVFEEDRAQVQQIFKDIVAEKKPDWLIEYRYLCADGQFKYVRDRGYLVFDAHGQALRMIGAMQDIDQQRRYEEQLLTQNKQLKTIAWINSHELRRPLCNILSLVDLIAESPGHSTDLQALLEMLSSSTQELDDVVKRIEEQTKS